MISKVSNLWIFLVLFGQVKKGTKLHFKSPLIRQRQKEGTFCASELAGIEPTPARSGRAGFARLNLSLYTSRTSTWMFYWFENCRFFSKYIQWGLSGLLHRSIIAAWTILHLQSQAPGWRGPAPLHPVKPAPKQRRAGKPWELNKLVYITDWDTSMVFGSIT